MFDISSDWHKTAKFVLQMLAVCTIECWNLSHFCVQIAKFHAHKTWFKLSLVTFHPPLLVVHKYLATTTNYYCMKYMYVLQFQGGGQTSADNFSEEILF